MAPTSTDIRRRSPTSLLLLALFALSAPLTSAAPLAASPTEPYIAKRSYNTPSAQLEPPTSYLENDASIASLIQAMAAAASASAAANKAGTPLRRAPLDEVLNVDLLQERGREEGGDTHVERQLEERAEPDCLDSTATDVTINSLFHYGGAGTVVLLCPRAKITLTNSIFFTAPNQVLATRGFPTLDTRALLIVTGDQQSTAIYGACDDCSGVKVQNIQVNGQRDVLGRIPTGLALLEMGGSTSGQVITQIKAYEPRGWSVLHAIEGNGLSCTGMTISNNQIGPSGWAPTASQFKKRDDIAPGQWADGISHACRNSIVQYNTITDTTDGGIVIFGAPGSTISNNVITAKTRRALGGINMVDWSPYSGSFEGTVVENNLINADSNMIKLGIAIGGMSWGSDNRTVARTFGGTVRNNVFQSGSNGFFGFGISVAGHMSANVYGNDATGANFGGLPTSFCIPNVLPPSPRAFVYDQWTTSGSLQSQFTSAPLVFLICLQPGPIAVRGQQPQPQLPKTTTTRPSTPTTTTTRSTTTTTTTTTTTKTTTTTTTRRTTTSRHPPLRTARTKPVQAAQAVATRNAYNPAQVGNIGVGVAQDIGAVAEANLAARAPARFIKRDGEEETETYSAPYSKQTPGTPVGMVNPFELLEKVQRL
ncbi:hypothetical protein BCR35DRAFT_304837, partial [Leucosporidium creatinivorum]